MKKGQPAFLLPIDQKEIVDELDNEEAGIIFKAIYEYEVNKVEINLPKTLKIVFKQFKVKLDNYDGAYEEKCQRNRENIRKYWEKKKADTTEYDRIRPNTNVYKIKEKKNKENKIKEKKRKREREYIYNNIPTLTDIISYANELNISKEYGEMFYNHYEAIGWVNGTGQKIKNWKLVFKNWIAQDNNKQSSNITKLNEGVFKI